MATATLAALAAALAVLASQYRFARVLLWIAALSFGSLGVVWSSTSEGYSLLTQMLVAAVIGAVAAAGLTWALWEVRTKEKAETKHSTAADATVTPTPRGPTLEATNRSKIDATDAIIPGDLPFQFGKADNDSIIDIPGIQVTKNENGSFTISPGQHVNRRFPPPTGEFSSLSNAELSKKVKSVASALRQFHSDFRKDTFPPYTKVGPLPEEYTRRSTENWRKYQKDYEEKFAPLALSLSAEMLARIGSVEGTSMPPSAIEGGTLVYYKRFMGSNAAESAADFLVALASKLPNH